MLPVPAETPVTNPELDTVATVVFSDTHAFEPASISAPVNWMFDPAHKAVLPLTTGRSFTVNVFDATQPLLSVYEMILVPKLVPLSNPLLFTTAIIGLLDIQGLVDDAMPEPLSCVNASLQIEAAPLIAGSECTFMLMLLLHPFTFV